MLCYFGKPREEKGKQEKEGGEELLTDGQLEELEKLAKKNDAVESILNFYNQIIRSPYLDSYITLYSQVADWNEQLKIKPDEIRKRVIGNDILGNVVTVDWMPGKIELFGDKDNKEFDRAFKYFSDIITIMKSLDDIRLKLLPQEEKEVEKVATTLMDEARIKMKQKNGAKV